MLGNKAQISDGGVSTLVNYCCELRVLELINCDISDKSVRFISASCPYLKRLSLAYCKKITDAAFQFDSAIFGTSGQVKKNIYLFNFLSKTALNLLFFFFFLLRSRTFPSQVFLSTWKMKATGVKAVGRLPALSEAVGEVGIAEEVSRSRPKTTSTICST